MQPIKTLLKSSWTVKLSLALASALISLLAAEIAFRLIKGEKVKLHGMYTADAELGVSLKPGFRGSMKTSEFSYQIAINDLGMRDAPVPAKAPNSRRVLVIGDSFVFGVGVAPQHSLPQALQRQLRRSLTSSNIASSDIASSDIASSDIEVFNGGVPGFSPFHEVEILRRLAPVIEPDLVVMNFFAGDDWFGNTPRASPGQARKRTGHWLQRHSSLYRYLNRFLFSRVKSRERYAIHLKQPTQDLEGRTIDVLSYLAAAQGIAEQHGAEFLVTIAPRYSQVYDDAWAKASLVFRLSPDEYSRQEPNRWLLQRLHSEGFWALDLLDPLRQEAAQRLLNFPIDGHWNLQGNDFVASLITDEILSRWPAQATGRAASQPEP